jgi:phage recombination protein Bet
MQIYTADQIELIKNTVAQGATDDELQMFVGICQKAGLDPFMRQIHFIKRGGRATIQTGIDGFRAIAERTGQYAGNDEYLYNGDTTEYECLKEGIKTPTTAKAVVRKVVGGVICEFSAVASWVEYCPQGGEAFMWTKMPYLMLGKCAESQALRKAFPNDLSGLYTSDEMDQAGTPVTIQKASSNKAENIKKEIKAKVEKKAEKKVVKKVVKPPVEITPEQTNEMDDLLKSVDLDKDKKEKTEEWLGACTPTYEAAQKCIVKLKADIDENHKKRTAKTADEDLPF